jgi:phage terminase large subunit
MTIHSSNIFAKVYNKNFRMILNHEKERYTFTGGRASTKSSFISIVIVVLITMFPKLNALVVRKTAKSLRRSVFEQIVWAIDLLHLRYTKQRGTGFKIPKSQTAALPITYTRKDGTTQQIIFAGCDDPEKIKVTQGSAGLLCYFMGRGKNRVQPRRIAECKNIGITRRR